jgi:hypothetical protein
VPLHLCLRRSAGTLPLLTPGHHLLEPHPGLPFYKNQCPLTCSIFGHLATVNTATARATLPFSSNYFLPNVHYHSPELQGHLQGINDHRTHRLHHGMPPPQVNPPPFHCPAPPMSPLRCFLARRTPHASLVRVVKTFFPLGHQRIIDEHATVWPVSAVTTCAGVAPHRSVWAAKATVGPWVDCPGGTLWPFGLAGTTGRQTSGTLTSGRIWPRSG